VLLTRKHVYSSVSVRAFSRVPHASSAHCTRVARSHRRGPRLLESGKRVLGSAEDRPRSALHHIAFGNLQTGARGWLVCCSTVKPKFHLAHHDTCHGMSCRASANIPVINLLSFSSRYFRFDLDYLHSKT